MTISEYATTQDEADTRAYNGEEVYVVWTDGSPNFFSDIDGAYDFSDANGHPHVLDYVTGEYA